jgi:hypothetical protein
LLDRDFLRFGYVVDFVDCVDEEFVGVGGLEVYFGDV